MYPKRTFVCALCTCSHTHVWVNNGMCLCMWKCSIIQSPDRLCKCMHTDHRSGKEHDKEEIRRENIQRIPNIYSSAGSIHSYTYKYIQNVLCSMFFILFFSSLPYICTATRVLNGYIHLNIHTFTHIAYTGIGILCCT